VAFPIPSPAVRLETERLYLRPYRVEDAPWYAAMSLRNRKHLRRFEGGNAAMTIESAQNAERVLTEFAADWQAGRAFFLGAFLRATDEFVAQIYVGVSNRDLPEFEVGFFADAQREGQGYVSEAVRGALPFLFGDLGGRRVRLECDDTNARSARVARRSGFKLEGHIRENHPWPNGSVTGTLLYGMLASEFVARQTAGSLPPRQLNRIRGHVVQFGR
jgi:aminoglycoside 6'-N-acetyltransferase